MLSFHVKIVQTDGWMDGWTDRRTMVKQYAPDILIRGHKKKKKKKKKKVFGNGLRIIVAAVLIFLQLIQRFRDDTVLVFNQESIIIFHPH